MTEDDIIKHRQTAWDGPAPELTDPQRKTVDRFGIHVLHPECKVGKHGNCWGDAWADDKPHPCECPCHEGLLRDDEGVIHA